MVQLQRPEIAACCSALSSGMPSRPWASRAASRILSFAPAVSRWAFVQAGGAGVQLLRRVDRPDAPGLRAAQVLRSALDARQAVVGGHPAGDVLGEVGAVVEATLAATERLRW